VKAAAAAAPPPCALVQAIEQWHNAHPKISKRCENASSDEVASLQQAMVTALYQVAWVMAAVRRNKIRKNHTTEHSVAILDAMCLAVRNGW
jgi:hypothetical protein